MRAWGTVLLTGASGFIGSHLSRRLSAQPEVRLVEVARRRRPDANGRIQVSADLKSLSPETWKAHGVESIDVVFHFGAFTPKSAAQANDVEQVFETNLIGTRRLLESLPAGLKTFVFASTLDVYGRTDAVLTEKSPLNPISLYGASKLFSELHVREHCERSSIRFAVLRFGHIYGPGEDAYEKFIPNMIRTILSGRRPTVAGDGSVMRDFLYVDDAVEAAMRAAFGLSSSVAALNIVSGQSRSFKSVVESLRSVTGYAEEALFTGDPGGTSFSFDNRMMREVLGDWPFMDFDAGLAEEVRHAQARAQQQTDAG